MHHLLRVTLLPVRAERGGCGRELPPVWPGLPGAGRQRRAGRPEPRQGAGEQGHRGRLRGRLPHVAAVSFLRSGAGGAGTAGRQAAEHGQGVR